jgi:hypothetical protein
MDERESELTDEYPILQKENIVLSKGSFVHIDWSLALAALSLIAYPSWKEYAKKKEKSQKGQSSGGDFESLLNKVPTISEDPKQDKHDPKGESPGDQKSEGAGALEISFRQVSSIKKRESDSKRRTNFHIHEICVFAIRVSSDGSPVATPLFQKPFGLSVHHSYVLITFFFILFTSLFVFSRRSLNLWWGAFGDRKSPSPWIR